MRSIGIVREVDELGRMVIPQEIRDRMDIDFQDPLEIYVEGEKIILKKYVPGCVFCGTAEETISYRGQKICTSCRQEMVPEKDKEE